MKVGYTLALIFSACLLAVGCTNESRLTSHYGPGSADASQDDDNNGGGTNNGGGNSDTHDAGFGDGGSNNGGSGDGGSNNGGGNNNGGNNNGTGDGGFDDGGSNDGQDGGGGSLDGGGSNDDGGGSGSDGGELSDGGNNNGDDPDPTVFYVTTSGSDSNDGTTPAKAWRTLSHALPQLSTGHTLRVGGGTYEEEIDLSNPSEGTSNDEILVINRSGERPVVSGHVRLEGLVYWVWDGINVTREPGVSDQYSELVEISDGLGWQFRNAEVWGGLDQVNLRITGSSSTDGRPGGFTVENNCIHDVQARPHGPNQPPPPDIYHNIQVDFPQVNGQESGVIERNLLYGSTHGAGVWLGGSAGDPTNMAISYNTVHNATQSITVAGSTSNVFISDNLLNQATAQVQTGLSQYTSTLIYAHELSGTRNSYGNNYGWGASAIYATGHGSTESLTDIGGNDFDSADPSFNQTSDCLGFQPSNPTASNYGRWAP